jgi:DNA polymerase III subunit alpha
MLLLRSYTHYSLLSAIPKVPALIKNALDKGYTTVALTDEDTSTGLIEMYDKANELGVKPILGVTLAITNIIDSEGNYGRHAGFGKVALLAKNNDGYKAILKLISIARIQKDSPKYHIDLEDLSKLRETKNYIVNITDDHEFGNLVRKGNLSEAIKCLEKYVKIIGNDNICVELLMKKMNESEEECKQYNLSIAKICRELNVLFFASPAPRYLESIDSEPFEAVLAIKKQVRVYDIKLERDFSLPSFESLKQTYNYLPEALEFEKFNELFESDILRTDYADKASEAFFPPVELNEGETYDDLLALETYLGLISRFHPLQENKHYWKKVYGYTKLEQLKIDCKNLIVDPNKLVSYPQEYWHKDRIGEYIKQIEIELEIIFNKGYSSYFLVVADLAQYCVDNNITASARGSGAGSLIGYLNNISTADTVFYQIPFERFLNPLRPSAPDVDLDVADEKRSQVIKYLVEKYGSDRVCQVGTYGTMAPRAAVRDVGRVLGISYRKCDQLSKIIPSPPFGKKPTFKYAFENSKEFAEVYEKDEEVNRIVEIAKIIEGNYRHASVHAAAVMVTPTSTSDYSALQWDSDKTMQVTQYDWHDCEKIGILPCKMDILGITNLSILSNSIELVKKNKGIDIDLFNINLKDDKVYKLLAEGKTMGVFQLSGGGITKYLIQLRPSKIEDLMAMVALYRPGAMNSIPEFIRRKNNPDLIKYYVPEMKEWMEGTYGILVYQEDIMFTFMKLAGYNFGQADNVRRAMGKKKKEVLDKEYSNFESGCKEHGISAEKIKELWDLIVPFTDYSFNKAHSSAYGIVAYWTAYMKANYPAEFMTALMTSEEGDMTKIASAINECKIMEIKISPPNINIANENYRILSDTNIVYGLGSVKNLGSDVIKFIVTEREQNGLFTTMENFISRMALYPAFNKRSLEALIFSGALDEIEV